MKRFIFALILFCSMNSAQTTLTLGQVEDLCKAKWGKDARLWQVGQPNTTTTGWRWQYMIGVQEYYGAKSTGSNVFGDDRSFPGPLSGQPLPLITVRGRGTSWQKAWESVAP